MGHPPEEKSLRLALDVRERWAYRFAAKIGCGLYLLVLTRQGEPAIIK